ncbi:TPA: S-layer protein [archaeon]|uniref:S-layer protein n=1 Tax=Candidatus Naiadarchaeum limnaeum TaxID=2756139 RepID=A0A832UV46_9ARCH|nr:S-layer protein [Candidatus Naiadarchaeum limnaeum]
MYIVEKQSQKLLTLPAKEVKGKSLSVFGSELANRILKFLPEGPAYPKEIAQKLNVHEQKVYYHIKNFERNGLVRVARTENRQGAVAKYYELTEPAFVVRFSDLRETTKISATNENAQKFLDPFVKDGKLNCTIIIGSPQSHGPERARSNDGYYAIDIALFLGSYLSYYSPEPVVKLDTELRNGDLKQNIISLGGPIVNKITERMNAKMPVRFDYKTKNIISKVSGKTYNADETGLVVKMPNPYSKGHWIIIVAGKRYSGTRAATIALTKHTEELAKGNKKDKKVFAKVVEGLDLNSDGIVDEIEFLE